TRGMGLWKGRYQGDYLGWDSPIKDGPVHPSFVNLLSNGGIGWIDGFDELLPRCGLENNGAGYEVKTVNPDGSESRTVFPLHGRIANTPANMWRSTFRPSRPMKSPSKDTSTRPDSSAPRSAWSARSAPRRARTGSP